MGHTVSSVAVLLITVYCGKEKGIKTTPLSDCLDLDSLTGFNGNWVHIEHSVVHVWE